MNSEILGVPFAAVYILAWADFSSKLIPRPLNKIYRNEKNLLKKKINFRLSKRRKQQSRLKKLMAIAEGMT